MLLVGGGPLTHLATAANAAVAVGVLRQLKAARTDVLLSALDRTVHQSAQPSEAAPAPASSSRTVTVNGKRVKVSADSTILDAAKVAGVYIPTLCKHPRLPNTPGTCRLCMVEVDGRMRPACATPVHDGAAVQTDTEEVRFNARSVLTMLRANHPEDCMTCDVNGKCEFQDLIQRYKVPKLPKLMDVSDDYKLHTSHWSLQDHSSLAVRLDREKCIKCGRCVTQCGDVQGMNVLGFFERGRDRHVGFMFETDMDVSKCIECGQCVSVCPVGALSERTEWREVLDALQEGKKIMVAQTAPAVRVAIGEEVGLAAGSISTGQMVAGLRALGFQYVFDTDFSADLTIMEEGHELLARLGAAWSGQQPDGHHTAGPLPMFTSCCPAWVTMVEKSYPELIPHLSTAKSPQQMLGAMVKEYWAKKAGVKVEDVCMVSVMPCTAKKHEAERPEMGSNGMRHVDYVLTTRELGRLLRYQKIPMASLPHQEFDQPLGTGTGAATLFGNTGGVMEAAVRTVYEVVTGKELPRMTLDAVRGLAGVKEATLKLQLPENQGSKEVRVAVASGIHNARELIERIRSGEVAYDFVEVMSCPGGCIGGGGQPKTKDPFTLVRRMESIYNLDERSVLRKSHDNPDVKQVYDEFLGKPNGDKAHELLHTHYHDRSGQTSPPYTTASKLGADVSKLHVTRDPRTIDTQLPTPA